MEQNGAVGGLFERALGDGSCDGGETQGELEDAFIAAAREGCLAILKMLMESTARLLEGMLLEGTATCSSFSCVTCVWILPLKTTGLLLALPCRILGLVDKRSCARRVVGSVDGWDSLGDTGRDGGSADGPKS